MNTFNIANNVSLTVGRCCHRLYDFVMLIITIITEETTKWGMLHGDKSKTSSVEILIQ
mgnify:CR=1 FL=1